MFNYLISVLLCSVIYFIVNTSSYNYTNYIMGCFQTKPQTTQKITNELHINKIKESLNNSSTVSEIKKPLLCDYQKRTNIKKSIDVDKSINIGNVDDKQSIIDKYMFMIKSLENDSSINKDEKKLKLQIYRKEIQLKCLQYNIQEYIIDNDLYSLEKQTNKSFDKLFSDKQKYAILKNILTEKSTNYVVNSVIDRFNLLHKLSKYQIAFIILTKDGKYDKKLISDIKNCIDTIKNQYYMSGNEKMCELFTIHDEDFWNKPNKIIEFISRGLIEYNYLITKGSITTQHYLIYRDTKNITL